MTGAMIEARTAEQHRDAAERWRSKAAKARMRTPDAINTVWSHELNALTSDAKAALADNLGMVAVPALFDTDGELVAATVSHDERGEVWSILSSDAVDSAPLETIVAEGSTAGDYTIGTVYAPGKVIVTGFDPLRVRPGVGGVATVRADGGYSDDVVVIATTGHHES